MTRITREDLLQLQGRAPRPNSVGAVAAARQCAPERAAMLVIGIDPANNCGWAAWHQGRVVATGTLRAVEREGGAEGVDVAGTWRVCRQLADQHPGVPVVMVLEDQHPLPARDLRGVQDDVEFEKQRSIQYRGMDALVRQVEARQTWEVRAVDRGWRVVRVMPVTWQCALLSRKPGVKRDELKQRSFQYARACGVDAVDDNQADSVCVGAWWVQGGNPPEKKKKAKAAGRSGKGK